MDYPKSVPNIGLVDGHFVDENPVTGQIGSLIPAAWGDAITQEVLNVIKGAGMVPDEANVSQLLSAVLAIAASDFKKSVRAATTGPIALSGVQAVDGVVLVAGDRVLVKNQANAAQNWIYIVAAGAWVRAQDANESEECTPGHLVSVQAGTVNAGSIWQLSNTTPPVLGTTALNFVLALGKTGVAAGTYRQVVVDASGRVTAGANPTTLAGYGINDAYTKAQSDAALALRAALESPALTGAPTAPTAPKSANNTQIANTAFVKAAIAELVASSPAALDTLYELAAALGNDPNFAATMANALARKADAATTLAGYGILDAVSFANKALMADAEGGVDNAKWVTPAGVSVAISTALAGSIGFFATNISPGGWIKANGAAVSRTTYARLFNVIGTTFGAGNGTTTFQLPDMRGLFLRGWDDGRGIDGGRPFGSYQDDSYKSHAHDLLVYSTDTQGSKAADSNGGGTMSTTTTEFSGGWETRPRNLALLACIKY